MIRGVIFDMDGLMFDTEALWDTFWAPVCARLGLHEPDQAFLDDKRGLAGEAMIQAIAEQWPGADPVEIFEGTWAEAERFFAGNAVPCKPGLRELLAWLAAHGIPCAVASSSIRGMVQSNLKNNGIENHFSVVIGGEDVQNSKPDPEVFLLAAGRLGVDIRDCLVLEDSHNGVRAGHASGAKTVMVPDLMPVTDEMRGLYDRCCTSLLEVRDLLEQGAL